MSLQETLADWIAERDKVAAHLSALNDNVASTEKRIADAESARQKAKGPVATPKAKPSPKPTLSTE